ncbi:MAG: hypothetical protein AAB877_00305 [Patescibacteria group bacterium]
MENLIKYRLPKKLITAGKIAITILLVLFLAGFEWQNKEYLISGLYFAIFLVLPTIFVFFAKDRLMSYPNFVKFWKWGKFIYVFLIILSFSLIILGIWRGYNRDRTEEAIARIDGTRITLADVMGDNLPPVPDKALNNSTIAGIDANNNKIRDDVELAIFERYPNSAKIRAAMLQYAQALQLELTEVFNSESLVAVIQKEDLAYGCLLESGAKMDNSQSEAQNLVLNNDSRKERVNDIFEYLISHGYKDREKCDINALPLNE